MAFKALDKIRFSDVDRSGIVYYPRFAHFFHVAFEEFFEGCLGVSYPHMLGVEKIGFPTVHVETDFTAPLRFGDRTETEVIIDKVGNKSAVFRYILRRQGEADSCAIGVVTVAAVDMDTFRAIEIPPKYRSLFMEYKQHGTCSGAQGT